MRRFAVLGNPIEHSKSPEIHRAFADSCRHDIDYRKVLVEAGQFDTVVNDFFARGGIGLNVTAPFKGEAFEFAEVHTSDAIDAQAVNTLWRDDQGRICGHTTDGSGLARDLEVNLHWQLAGAHILLLGAGGAMRGILGPLCDRSPASVHVANRTSQRAIDLVALFEGRGSLTAGGLTTIPDREWSLVINGLSSGWAGDFPDLEIPRISPDASAYDLIYSDKPTPFMTWADSRGFQQVSDGLGMLVEQAADSYEIWNDERPLTHDVLAMLRA